MPSDTGQEHPYPPLPKLDLVDGAVDQLLNRLASVQMDLTAIIHSPADPATGERAKTACDALQQAIDFIRDQAKLYRS